MSANLRLTWYLSRSCPFVLEERSSLLLLHEHHVKQMENSDSMKSHQAHDLLHASS